MKKFLMSVVVFSPVLLCAMQGDSAAPAVAGVDAPVAEDQARKDAAVYESVIIEWEYSLMHQKRFCDRTDFCSVDEGYNKCVEVLSAPNLRS